MANSDSKRVIITPELLIEIFGQQPLEIMLYIMSFFISKEGRALQEFDKVIEHFKKQPDGHGKNQVCDAFTDLKSAYEKMTLFERNNVRKRLPEKICEFLEQKNKSQI